MFLANNRRIAKTISRKTFDYTFSDKKMVSYAVFFLDIYEAVTKPTPVIWKPIPKPLDPDLVPKNCVILTHSVIMSINRLVHLNTRTISSNTICRLNFIHALYLFLYKALDLTVDMI